MAALEKDEQRRQKALLSYDRLMTKENMMTAKDMRETYQSVEDYEVRGFAGEARSAPRRERRVEYGNG